MKKKTKRNPLMDYIKALRKGSRDDEIELYGKPLPKQIGRASCRERV